MIVASARLLFSTCLLFHLPCLAILPQPHVQNALVDLAEMVHNPRAAIRTKIRVPSSSSYQAASDFSVEKSMRADQKENLQLVTVFASLNMKPWPLAFPERRDRLKDN